MSIKETLEKEAKKVRLKLDNVNFAEELDHLELLKDFPKECCKPSALIFLYYLKNYIGVNASEMYLLANAEITKGMKHAWSSVNSIHVDLTGDQFGKAEIIISEENPWKDIYKEPDKFSFKDETFNEEFERDLIRVCKYINE